MKINDILKEENAGKVYKITDGEYEGETVFITNCLSAEITLNGRTDDIEDVIRLIDILEMEFEEEKPYKEISGREALKLMLDGGVAYRNNYFDCKYYMEGNYLKYEDVFGEEQQSLYKLSDILRLCWYIKN